MAKCLKICHIRVAEETGIICWYWFLKVTRCLFFSLLSYFPRAVLEKEISDSVSDMESQRNRLQLSLRKNLPTVGSASEMSYVQVPTWQEIKNNFEERKRKSGGMYWAECMDFHWVGHCQERIGVILLPVGSSIITRCERSLFWSPNSI